MFFLEHFFRTNLEKIQKLLTVKKIYNIININKKNIFLIKISNVFVFIKEDLI